MNIKMNKRESFIFEYDDINEIIIFSCDASTDKKIKVKCIWLFLFYSIPVSTYELTYVLIYTLLFSRRNLHNMTFLFFF